MLPREAEQGRLTVPPEFRESAPLRSYRGREEESSPLHRRSGRAFTTANAEKKAPVTPKRRADSHCRKARRGKAHTMPKRAGLPCRRRRRRGEPHRSAESAGFRYRRARSEKSHRDRRAVGASYGAVRRRDRDGRLARAEESGHRQGAASPFLRRDALRMSVGLFPLL